jgi:hypothetical protein
MSIAAETNNSRNVSSPGRVGRVLRWTFRREDRSLVCELGLNSEDSAYELRFNPPWNPELPATERFDDATSAFQRHAEIEHTLVGDGWLLEAFESERVAR